ncbi:hypothetical protein MUA04_03615 [Enterobacteriaceae bacterium H11S18]|uniref:hypothetical protein n=1 Tax=Dryocola clanedunensis TaxID=2925396 RepID=UPI0022F0C8EB|nr:hypothetical protein [Dryocola clanedunensis]MCT4708734.1 hypothetical protein [Dryocola clanedunensis]MCT4709282.1 hypothetical protein [Dryocola clanedunensis]
MKQTLSPDRFALIAAAVKSSQAHRAPPSPRETLLRERDRLREAIRELTVQNRGKSSADISVRISRLLCRIEEIDRLVDAPVLSPPH